MALLKKVKLLERISHDRQYVVDKPQQVLASPFLGRPSEKLVAHKNIGCGEVLRTVRSTGTMRFGTRAV